jgi:hypothetical protein
MIAGGNAKGTYECQDQVFAGQAAAGEGVLDGAAREWDVIAFTPLLQDSVGRVSSAGADFA